MAANAEMVAAMAMKGAVTALAIVGCCVEMVAAMGVKGAATALRIVGPCAGMDAVTEPKTAVVVLQTVEHNVATDVAMAARTAAHAPATAAGMAVNLGPRLKKPVGAVECALGGVTMGAPGENSANVWTNVATAAVETRKTALHVPQIVGVHRQTSAISTTATSLMREQASALRPRLSAMMESPVQGTVV